jgi:hypothetical protein
MQGFVEGNMKGRNDFSKPRHRWEENIKIDLKEIEWETVDCSNQAQGPAQAVVDTVIDCGL